MEVYGVLHYNNFPVRVRLWRTMEDAAILSAIFDEEAEELNSDEANDFHEPDSLTKGRRIKSATCKKLDLSKNTTAGEDFERGSDGNPEPMPEPMPEPIGTKPVKAKRTISSNIAKQATKDPVSVDEGSDDDVAQNNLISFLFKRNTYIEISALFLPIWCKYYLE